MENKDAIKLVKFKDLNLEDPFFDSLRDDYEGFNDWFERKALSDSNAYVLFKSDGMLQAFLYLKQEKDEDTTISPSLPQCNKLKVGTFKVEAHKTSLGQRFMNIIVQALIRYHFDLTYVTFYPKQVQLKTLFKKYGFEKWGMKNNEEVYYKDLKVKNSTFKDFPRINEKRLVNKFLLGIYPKYHTELFPDSKLCNEKDFVRKDISFSNSIIKCYLGGMEEMSNFKPNDLIAIYRTKDNWANSAFYNSVVTSVCTVIDTRNINDFTDFSSFKKYVGKETIFSEQELKYFYETKRYPYIVKMLYNFPLNKRITNGELRTKLNIVLDYWGCAELNNNQFNAILKYGEINEDFIIN